jgi:hypothetical protein
MTTQKRTWALLISAVVMGTAALAYGQAQPTGIMKARDASAAATTSGGNLIDHGGLVLPTSTIYAIWWGDPAAFPADAQDGVDQFLSGLNGSSYLGIANQYMRGASATTRFGGNLYNPSSPPPAVPETGRGSSNMLDRGLCTFFKSAGVQPNPTDIYLLYTSNFPAAEGSYCAFHGYTSCSNINAVFQVAYVPNGTDVRSCDPTVNAPLFEPNGYTQGTQALINMTAHEFTETITDPQFTAWYDSGGYEIGDKCVWVFASEVPLANGSPWKIQEEWSNQLSRCGPGTGSNAQVLGVLSNSGTITTFNTADATYGTFARSMNKGGAIAGWYYNTDGEIVGPGQTEVLGERGFVRDPSGTITPFDGPGSNVTEASSINSVGAIVGDYYDASFVQHGFVRGPSGVVTSFDASPVPGTFTIAESINDMGAIAGVYGNHSSGAYLLLYHGFVRDPAGDITTFDAPASKGTTTTGTVPLSINTAGAIAGYYSDASAVNHGFLRDQHSSIIAIDAPGAGIATGQGTIAQSINGSGAIAGYYSDAGNVNHGFVRDQYGTFTTFDAPGATYGTFVYSINAAGSVAGYYSDSGGLSHAFVRTVSGNFSTPSTSVNGYGSVARSINDLGAIAGYATVPSK